MTKNKKSLAEAFREERKQKTPIAKTADTEEEIKKLITRLNKSAHYQLKSLAHQQDNSLQNLACEAINDLFIKYNLPPIAKTNKDKKMAI